MHLGTAYRYKDKIAVTDTVDEIASLKQNWQSNTTLGYIWFVEIIFPFFY